MADNHRETKGSRIVFLDYLRIFAFSSVLVGHKFSDYLQHTATNESIHATARLLASWLLPFCFGGGAGVVVFFLVSGFIITHVLRTERPLEFLIKRLFRIYPLYIIAVLMHYLVLYSKGTAPSMLILVQQLSLLGDFFKTPLALNVVEWTLRLEILFYIFMVVLRCLGLTTRFISLLPYVLIVACWTCGRLAPFPVETITRGYATMYAPFLLLGSMFYLYDRRLSGLPVLLAMTALTFYEYFSLTAAYQSGWIIYHFAALAFLLFIACFAMKERMSAPAWVLLLSDMTYSVYLFHNWLFDELKAALLRRDIMVFHSDLQALMVLLLVCFVAMKAIEKPANRLAHRILRKA